MDTNEHEEGEGMRIRRTEAELIRALRGPGLQVLHTDGGITPFNRRVVCFEACTSDDAERISFLLRKIRHEQEHELLYGESL